MFQRDPSTPHPTQEVISLGGRIIKVVITHFIKIGPVLQKEVSALVVTVTPYTKTIRFPITGMELFSQQVFHGTSLSGGHCMVVTS